MPWQRIWSGRTSASGRVSVPLPTSDVGSRQLRVKVRSTARFSERVSATNSISVSSPEPTPTPSPTPTATTTVYVTGDVGQSGGGMALTADQLTSVSDPVILPGDITYTNGTSAEYAANYTPYFGSFVDRSWPVPGNHDYGTGWPYYFTYFGSRVGSTAQPWYAKQFGSWLFLMLDSNCTRNGGCDASSAQYAWVTQQLQSFTGKCVAAVWHHPRWSDGPHGDNATMGDMFALLRANDVEALFSGHDHDYERFMPSDANGTYDAQGVAEFVVGTGGASLYDFATTSTLTAARSKESHGVLKLELSETGYAWSFLPTSGSFADSGTANCH